MLQTVPIDLLDSRRAAAAEITGHARFAMARLAAFGAIMTLPGRPPERHLMGYTEWLDDHRLFWFPAFGDRLTDGRCIRFDEVKVIPGLGVVFQFDAEVLGRVSSIEGAGVPDPADYEIAWTLWQQVLPLRTSFIRSCAEQFTAEPPIATFPR